MPTGYTNSVSRAKVFSLSGIDFYATYTWLMTTVAIERDWEKRESFDAAEIVRRIIRCRYLPAIRRTGEAAVSPSRPLICCACLCIHALSVSERRDIGKRDGVSPLPCIHSIASAASSDTSHQFGQTSKSFSANSRNFGKADLTCKVPAA